jgi:hypothetical protein
LYSCSTTRNVTTTPADAEGGEDGLRVEVGLGPGFTPTLQAAATSAAGRRAQPRFRDRLISTSVQSR